MIVAFFGLVLVIFRGNLIDILVKLIAAMPKLLGLFAVFVDPGKFLKDVIYGLFFGIKMIFKA